MGLRPSAESRALHASLSRRELLRRGALLGAVPLLGMAPPAAGATGDRRAAFLDTSRFQAVWAATDQDVASGAVSRTWIWGPAPIAQLQEPYAEAPGGQRTVVYYDKARMEDNSYRASPPWDVTTGLLAKDLITGKRQVGDSTFETRSPAEINIAGDPDDLNAPVYRSFTGLLGNGPIPVGWTITQTVNRAGQVGDDASLASHGVTVARLVADTNHTVASVFARFMDTYSGVPYGNAYYLTGFPISEAYWATVKVGGAPRQVLVQAFERRVLTYTPDNPAGWQVEMGNVGQHYHTWLYGPTTLREVATPKGLWIGMQGSYPLLQSDQKIDQTFTDVLVQQFNLLVHTGMLWDTDSPEWQPPLRPSQDVFDFAPSDRVVDFAQSNAMDVMAFHLVWGGFLPAWLTQDSFTSAELAAILQNHIQTVVAHYSTPARRIQRWSVVNEPVTTFLWGSDAKKFWYQHLGYDFVNEMAFRWARQAGPDATLMLCESFSGDTTKDAARQIRNGLLQIVQDFKAKNVPIDAVGFQMHLDSTNAYSSFPPNPAVVKESIQMFRDLGVDVHVTEFDVNLTDVTGSEEQRLATEATIYRDMLTAFLEAGGKSFSMFGMNDRYSWYTQGYSGVPPQPQSEATPFDQNSQPKPAYYALLDVLQRYPAV